jgi:hypothetical protein
MIINTILDAMEGIVWVLARWDILAIKMKMDGDVKKVVIMIFVTHVAKLAFGFNKK